MNVRRWRWPLVAVTVLIAGSAVAAMMAGAGSTVGTLDPSSASPDGGRALATLLTSRGVTVSAVRSTADAVDAVTASGSDTTLLVTDPALLTRPQLMKLASLRTGRVVLVQADYPSLEVLAPGVADLGSRYDYRGSGSVLAPGCPDADATAAGDASIGDAEMYSIPEAATGCYADSSGFSSFALVTVSGPLSTDTVLVGSRTPFRNDELNQNGNAALTMRLLGKHSKIVWYLPDSTDPAAVEADGRKGFSEVIPAGWRWATLMLGIAVVLLAVWQARRLGPVVVENLPVVVRAAETVEGRARLYERGRVHGRAANALREATRSRMAARLGLPRSASPADVAALLTARGGRPAQETMMLLSGPAPANDEQLVRLAAALDQLEAEMSRL